VSAARRTSRDVRRRRLGQNFLRPERAERLVLAAGVRAGEHVLEVGAGAGALTFALARRGVEVRAFELDPVWARRLRDAAAAAPGPGRVQVVEGDFLMEPLPAHPFRVIGSVPFGRTTALLRRLLDDPRLPLWRADLLVQWEVARKRAAEPPATLLSTRWAPWWELRIASRIPARAFRPVPRVDAAHLTVTRREAPLLPPAMAEAWARFLEAHWPFPAAGAAPGRAFDRSPRGR